MLRSKLLMLVLFLITGCAAITPSPNSIPTSTPKPTQTPKPTISPTNNPTHTTTAKPTPTPLPIIKTVENLVLTQFNDPASATWVLLIKPSYNIDANKFSGLRISLNINGRDYGIDIQTAVSDIETFGGIVFDYDEDLFLEPELSVNFDISAGEGSYIYKGSFELINWSSTGLISFPEEYSTGKNVFEFENIIVCELDDYDPSSVFASSLTDVNYKKWRIDQQGNIHGGFEQNDANAIDLSFANMNDNSKILLSLHSSEKVFDFNYFESFYEKGLMDSNLQFSTPVSVLVVEEDGDIVKAPIIWRIGHMRYSDEDIPILNSLLNHSIDQIPEGTVIGYVERQGQGHVIMNIAVYANYCHNNSSCTWQNPGEDTNALILPFALFVNHDQEIDIIEAFLRSNPETK